VSAWLVSKKHIDVLVHARSIPTFWNVPENEIDSTQLGQMLWRENMYSLEARYSDKIDEELIQSYSYTEPQHLPIITIIKSFSCYEYQSCEHESWKMSPSYVYCHDMKLALITCLPGYEEAPWGID
jgi:hypothetical protein